MKEKWKQMLPVILIIGITIITSILLYDKILDNEKEDCWKLLEDSANSVAREIRINSENSVNTLHLAADMISREWNEGADKVDISFLEKFQENTLFSRIEVLYPENQTTLGLSFQETAAKGEFMSPRMDDPDTGKQYVCYCVPVKCDEVTVAVLVGVIETDYLQKTFKTSIYDGKAACGIIDSRDGNFIMDQWHKELGNAYAMEKRKCLKDYENVDLKEETKAQKTGVIAFQSQTTGQILYMYYMPLQVFDWELETFVPDEAAFEKLNSLRQSLVLVAIIEIALLCVYFAGNIYSIRKLTESKKETEKQLHISDTLLQCTTALSINQDKDQAISRLLQIIMEYFKADRIGIFLYDPVRKFYLNKYGYAGTNMQAGIGDILGFPDRLLSKIEKAFETSQVCCISDVESDIESDKIWKARGTHSVLAVPLKKNGQRIGFVCVENASARVEDVTVLSTLPFFIVNSLIAKEQQEQLQFMSYWDSLTSMYNRNKYMQVIEKYQSQKLNKVGVIYLDLNGLKIINDRDGHEAGDKLICKAAQIICEVCQENAYRIGGDEFVAIEPEQNQEEFKRKVTALKEKVRQENISISIGSAWEEHCQDIKKLLKEADKFMYLEKQKYYKSKED